jgi:type III restriction enzyme
MAGLQQGGHTVDTLGQSGKRGPKSDEAYTRQVLGPLAKSQNILVINDEAHHTWRTNTAAQGKLTKEEKEQEKEATVWVSGLDRIHASPQRIRTMV